MGRGDFFPSINIDWNQQLKKEVLFIYRDLYYVSSYPSEILHSILHKNISICKKDSIFFGRGTLKVTKLMNYMEGRNTD